jgi:hypothetical protein
MNHLTKQKCRCCQSGVPLTAWPSTSPRSRRWLLISGAKIKILLRPLHLFNMIYRYVEVWRKCFIPLHHYDQCIVGTIHEHLKCLKSLHSSFSLKHLWWCNKNYLSSCVLSFSLAIYLTIYSCKPTLIIRSIVWIKFQHSSSTFLSVGWWWRTNHDG